MAKLDGMDPKLVRELLREVQQAGKEMQDVEARVTGLMRQAGVAVHVTYRPAQVADACASMVKDVTGRLTLLEKQEKQRSGNGKPAEDKGQKFHQEPDITMPADDPKPGNREADDAKGGHKPDQKADHKPDKADDKADHKPDKADGKADDHRASDKAGNGTKHGAASPGGTPHGAASATHSAADDATPAKTGGKSDRIVEGSLSQPPPSDAESAPAGQRVDPVPEQSTGQAVEHPANRPAGQVVEQPTGRSDVVVDQPTGRPDGQTTGHPAGQPNGQQPDQQPARPGDQNAYGTGTNGATSPPAGAGTGASPAGDASTPGGGTATCQCAGVCRCGMANGTGTSAVNGTAGTVPAGGTPTVATASVADASYTGVSYADAAHAGVSPTGTSYTDASHAGASSAGASSGGAGQGAGSQAPGVGVTNDAAAGTASTGAGNAAGTAQATQNASTGGVPIRDDSQIIDTPGKDHPDDVDQTAGRRVIVVDGVKVVSTPLNQPGIMDTPGAGAQPAHVVTGPHPDGPPGIVEPNQPAHPSGAGDTASTGTGTGHVGGGNAGQTGSARTGTGQEASGAAIPGSAVQPHHTPVQPSQPPAQPGQTSSHPGLAPGDPMGDYVGTPADNLTEDPFAAGGTDSVPGTPEDYDHRAQGDPPADDGRTRRDPDADRPIVVEVHLDTAPDDARTSGDPAQREVRL